MTNFLELVDLVSKKRKEIQKREKTTDRYRAELKLLLDTCTHDEFTMEESYMGGGYDYKATTTYWNQCTLCGKRSDKVTKIVGGFQ